MDAIKWDFLVCSSAFDCNSMLLSIYPGAGSAFSTGFANQEGVSYGSFPTAQIPIPLPLEQLNPPPTSPPLAHVPSAASALRQQFLGLKKEPNRAIPTRCMRAISSLCIYSRALLDEQKGCWK